MKEQKQIIRWAICSRIIIIILQAISNWLIPDHDAGVFVSPQDPQSNTTTCSQLTEIFFGGFRRWDAQYILHIAEHGYTYENVLAYYPLFPYSVRFASYTVQIVSSTQCSFRDISLIVAIILNVIFFTKATTTLYNLTQEIFKDRTYARIAAILFCFNPASIFFSAPYTESLFCWLSFSVMLSCSKGNIFGTIIPFCLGLICRSNGTVNFGFLLYYSAQCLLNVNGLFKYLKIVFSLIVASIAGFLTFTGVQYYFYSIYCRKYIFEMNEYVRTHGIENNYVIAGESDFGISPWCSYPYPFSYSYIQSHYWNIGFLNYYELKQIPNFLLATPTLILIIHSSICYLIRNSDITMRFGLEFKSSSYDKAKQFVYVVHVLFLSIFCLFFVHIQVSTRMLASSSPYLYWLCAEYFFRECKRSNAFDIFFKSKTKMAKLISFWFIGYYIIGTALFSNFLPWT